MRAAVDRLAQRVESVEVSIKALSARKAHKRWIRRSKVSGSRQKNGEEDLNTVSYAVSSPVNFPFHNKTIKE